MDDVDFVYNGVVHKQYMGERTGYEPDECDSFFLDDYFSGKSEIIVTNCNDNLALTDKKISINEFYSTDLKSDNSGCCTGSNNLNTIKDYVNEDNGCVCENYFNDNYFDDECNDTGNFLPSEYIEEEVEINPDEIYNSEGETYTKKGYYQIKTDNKFILFNRTETGFTVNNWDRENEEVILTGRTDWDNYNYHLLMNRTATGYTVNNINKYNEENRRKYNIYKDIVNNALGFRIKEDGSIGYRYATYDCENDDKYGVIEEYSRPNMVKDNEWSKIHIKIKPIDSKMVIMVYVNGNLVLISKELSKLELRGLDDSNKKQEGVPYNISLGGGTQGLLEAIYPDYYNQPQFILPLERDFCGTFLGDIKDMKIICGFLDYFLIKNYL
jgi:hypothetical protein